jgi:hypothetical protein
VTLLVARMIEERFHRDVEGRPIREGRTPAEFLRDGDIEYRTCPYAGSRQQHRNPMNMSALRQMGRHWGEVVDTLASLRAAHDAQRSVTEPQLMDVWRVSQLGSALPWFYLFRDGTIPAAPAALAKATLGMGIWAQRVLVRTITEGFTPPTLTAESVLALAEDNGTLIGETEVCSGGDKMLLEFFDVLVGAPSVRAPADDAILAFGAHYAGFKVFVWLYYLARRFLYADAEARSGTSPALAALRESAVEPSDFFIIEPRDPAAIAPAQRTGWFRSLADLMVPFAPARADQPLRDAGFALATVMGQGRGPAETFVELDALFGRVVAHVESGFRAAIGASPDGIEVPAGARDRLLGASPRDFFARMPNAGQG